MLGARAHWGLLPLLALLAFALAGCSASNGVDGQSVAGGNSLAYNGASGGQQKTSFSCGGSGTIHLSANLGMGSVTFSVKDSSGKTVYSKTVSSTGQSAQDGNVSGAAGTWTLSADRAGSYGAFSGQYAVSVDC